jgi:hypothetical protein
MELFMVDDIDNRWQARLGKLMLLGTSAQLKYINRNESQYEAYLRVICRVIIFVRV